MKLPVLARRSSAGMMAVATAMPPRIPQDLSPELALIFRITHVANVPWVLDHGLHCSRSSIRNPNFVGIGNPELIEKRDRHPVPCGPEGTLGDYIPFYFTPCSPMLYNIKTGWGGVPERPNADIVILVSSLRSIHGNVDFVLTDRHAYLRTAEYHEGLDGLGAVDWKLLQSKDFRRDSEDPGKFERYQAEALIYRHLGPDQLLGIGCYNQSVRDGLRDEARSRGFDLHIEERKAWYF